VHRWKGDVASSRFDEDDVIGGQDGGDGGADGVAGGADAHRRAAGLEIGGGRRQHLQRRKVDGVDAAQVDGQRRRLGAGAHQRPTELFYARVVQVHIGRNHHASVLLLLKKN